MYFQAKQYFKNQQLSYFQTPLKFILMARVSCLGLERTFLVAILLF
jgi:hypothetical protein